MSDSLIELARLVMDAKTKISTLNAEVKILTAEKNDYETRVIAGMHAINQFEIRNEYGTFTLVTSAVPSDIDWETLHNWIRDNNMLHLLHHRIAVKEYSALIEMGETVPGVTPFNKTTLRTLKRK